MSAESSLGTFLRQGRERSGLSVDAVSSASRIVPHLVRALEAERHDVLPAPVYVRGFIRAYCEEVGVDVEEALRRYEEQVASMPAPSLRPLPPATAPRPPARRWRPVAAGGLLLVALGVGLTFFVSVGGQGRQPDAVASRVPPPPVVSASPVPDVSAARVASPAGSPKEALPAPAIAAIPSAPPAASPAAPPGEQVLRMRAVDTTWVRVAPEGGPVTEETLPPGAVREWRSAGRFRVSLGNAGGVEIEIDGRPLPALGQKGQVVHVTLPAEARP
jgi:cytoskeleton protein RodZ